jgi:hypothetical protein
MIRNWLRHWLGITDVAMDWRLSLGEEHKLVELLQERNRLAWERINAIEVEHSALSKKQAELSAILQEVRQLREMLADPKRQPITTRTASQYRTLMEQE